MSRKLIRFVAAPSLDRSPDDADLDAPATGVSIRRPIHARTTRVWLAGHRHPRLTDRGHRGSEPNELPPPSRLVDAVGPVRERIRNWLPDLLGLRRRRAASRSQVTPQRRNPDTRCSCTQLTEQVRWKTGHLARVFVAVDPVHLSGQYRVSQPVAEDELAAGPLLGVQTSGFGLGVSVGWATPPDPRDRCAIDDRRSARSPANNGRSAQDSHSGRPNGPLCSP
jgi:hypothetical protein